MCVPNRGERGECRPPPDVGVGKPSGYGAGPGRDGDEGFCSESGNRGR